MSAPIEQLRQGDCIEGMNFSPAGCVLISYS